MSDGRRNWGGVEQGELSLASGDGGLKKKNRKLRNTDYSVMSFTDYVSKSMQKLFYSHTPSPQLLPFISS